MKSISDMNRVELASFVASSLRECGITVVLSGGSCVSIYSEDKYVSMDLDFIETGLHSRTAISRCMRKLGFTEKYRYFVHPAAELLIEFPAGPLGIGNEPITDFKEVRTSEGILRLLTPTDCVKDRLAWFLHTGDTECLEQAYLVARQQKIDVQEIERWSSGEGKHQEFLELKDVLISTQDLS
ncbi:MAG: hypothetical protein U9P42_10480 [Candidatus Fermentibacteria bacterium]|nr:hypothetical protein [Candidatus Fermentibacteria bacterium]